MIQLKTTSKRLQDLLEHSLGFNSKNYSVYEEKAKKLFYQQYDSLNVQQKEEAIEEITTFHCSDNNNYVFSSDVSGKEKAHVMVGFSYFKQQMLRNLLCGPDKKWIDFGPLEHKVSRDLEAYKYKGMSPDITPTGRAYGLLFE